MKHKYKVGDRGFLCHGGYLKDERWLVTIIEITKEDATVKFLPEDEYTPETYDHGDMKRIFRKATKLDIALQ